MLQQIDKPRDAEAVLLARVYTLILSWSEPDAQAKMRDEREERTKKASEKNDEK